MYKGPTAQGTRHVHPMWPCFTCEADAAQQGWKLGCQAGGDSGNSRDLGWEPRHSRAKSSQITLFTNIAANDSLLIYKVELHSSPEKRSECSRRGEANRRRRTWVPWGAGGGADLHPQEALHAQLTLPCWRPWKASPSWSHRAPVQPRLRPQPREDPAQLCLHSRPTEAARTDVAHRDGVQWSAGAEEGPVMKV